MAEMLLRRAPDDYEDPFESDDGADAADAVGGPEARHGDAEVMRGSVGERQDEGRQSEVEDDKDEEDESLPLPSVSGRYIPRPLGEYEEGMNVARTRDEGRSKATLRQYREETKRFARFLSVDDARTLRALVGEHTGLLHVTSRGAPPRGKALTSGDATIDLDGFFEHPPRRSDVLIKAFLCDRTLSWVRSPGMGRKIVAALSREFERFDHTAEWNGREGNPANSPVVSAALKAHEAKSRRAETSAKGVDPVRYRDLDRFYTRHFDGRDLRDWDEQALMLYTAMLVGLNLCLRFDELSRLSYVGCRYFS